MAGLVVSCTTTQKSASDPQSQQKTLNVVVVDYKNIAQDHEEDYLKVEKYWKPVHQERINDGRMTAWLLLKVVNDEKKDIPYNYITLNVYPDMEKVTNGGATNEDWINAHGAQKIEDEGPTMRALTQKINNIIRRDHCTTVSGTDRVTQTGPVHSLVWTG